MSPINYNGYSFVPGVIMNITGTGTCSSGFIHVSSIDLTGYDSNLRVPPPPSPPTSGSQSDSGGGTSATVNTNVTTTQTTCTTQMVMYPGTSVWVQVPNTTTVCQTTQ